MAVSARGKVVEQHDPPAAAAHPQHLAGNAQRVWHDVQHIRRIDRIELGVGKGECACIHSAQRHTAQATSGKPRAGAGEHLRREIDGGDTAGFGIVTRTETGAHADFQNALTGLRRQPPHRTVAAVLETDSVHHVINRREPPVHAGNGNRRTVMGILQGWSQHARAPPIRLPGNARSVLGCIARFASDQRSASSRRRAPGLANRYSGWT